MLFNLTDTLLGYTSSQRHKVIVGVTNLLIGYYEGKNLLVISDVFYDHFSKVISDERALLSLRHLHSYTTYDYNVNNRFNVVLDNASGSGELLIDYFYDTSSIQPVNIIGENANDVEFYAVVTQIIKHIDKKNLAYTLIHGGGNTTAGRLKECQNNNELSLCIVDSDIKYYNAPKEGDTCGQVKTVYDPKNKFVCLIVIKVHEIENLLPPKFIVGRAKKESKKIAQKFIENGNEKYLRWYDLKSGISIEDIEDPLYKIFATELYEHLYDSSCTFDRYVLQCKRKKEKVFPELANNLIKKYLGLPIEKQVEYPVYFKDEWKEIANGFYDFACSREKDPINV